MSTDSQKIRVFIYVDGHRRFAKQVLMSTEPIQSLPEAYKFSYRTLIPRIQKIVSHVVDCNLNHDLAFFIYSHGTQQRDRSELDDAWREVLDTYPALVEQLCKDGIELKLVGDIEDIYYQQASKILRDGEAKTKHSMHDRLKRRVELYVHYSGRKELENDTHHSHFDGWDYDLVIRPGGERRLSDAPLHLMSYSELVFQDTLWPVYSPDDYDNALAEFFSRNRRFGK